MIDLFIIIIIIFFIKSASAAATAIGDIRKKYKLGFYILWII